jgi:hypothetical protein
MRLTLNIGTKNPAETLATLLVAGFTVHHFRLVEGEWEGVPETTLAIDASLGLPSCGESIAAARVLVRRVAEELGEQSIAVQWERGEGELIPPLYPFNPELFHPAESPDESPGGKHLVVAQ